MGGMLVCRKNYLLCAIAGILSVAYFAPAYADDDALSPRIDATNGNSVKRSDVKVHDSTVAINAVGKDSTIMLTNVVATSGTYALNASSGGSIDGTGVTASSRYIGLLSANGKIRLKDSVVTVTGLLWDDAGIVFAGIEVPDSQERYPTNEIILVNTRVAAENGAGILGPLASGSITLKNSKILADTLLRNKDAILIAPVLTKPKLTLDADRSVLEGGARTARNSTTIFNLSNGTQWIMKIGKGQEENGELISIDQRSVSTISALNVSDSAVIFKGPKEGHYQILYISGGSPGTTRVYDASGDAKLYLNTEWHGGLLPSEKIDRLLVDGDVSGNTTVYVRAVRENRVGKEQAVIANEAIAVLPWNVRGISAIQVRGRADESSFKLANGYVALGGFPYKYELNAYGPGSSRGVADVAQRSFAAPEDDEEDGKNKAFWDFRLQNAYLDTEKKIKALVPQVASYLVMPNALFSAGLADFSDQHASLIRMRDKQVVLSEMRGMAVKAEERKKGSFFSSSHDDRMTLYSGRTPLQYGYDADIRYAAAQTGFLFAALESRDITARFGLLGTYGKLSFTPKGMEGSDKSTLDKWSLSAYGGVQHGGGLYMDTLFSYGLLKGRIANAVTGNTATLDDAKIFGASATIGYQYPTKVGGLMLEPQAQFIYQRLAFGVISDSDGFDVEMGKTRQWSVRVGGRLRKTVYLAEGGSAVSFYGRVNFVRVFGDGGTIRIGDSFSLDRMGSLVEGGGGVNVHLSQHFALRVDISHQRKMQKAGISGTSFSGGVHYHF